MKHTKKNIAILSIVVMSTMTQGSLRAEDTCVIPSLLADRKKSDTFNVCIPGVLTRSVSLVDKRSDMTADSFTSEVSTVSALFLEDLALKLVDDSIDVPSHLLAESQDLAVPVTTPHMIFPNDALSFRSAEEITDRSLDESLEIDSAVHADESEIGTSEVSMIDLFETPLRSIDIEFTVKDTRADIENVVPPVTYESERLVSQELSTTAPLATDIAKTSSSVSKKSPAKIKAAAPVVIKTKMQKLRGIFGKRSHNSNDKK